MRNLAGWFSSETHQIQRNNECRDYAHMTRERLHEIIEMLELVDFEDAAFYLDEEGHLEAFLPLM